MRYVVGFAFTEDRRSVLLIRKNRPAWQAGKLNGVGGKVEPGEAPVAAMSREFVEETGLVVPPEAWREVVAYQGPDYTLHVFATVTDRVTLAQQTTDEVPVLLEVPDLWREATIGNLRWIVPLCLDPHVKGPVTVSEV